MKIFFRLLVRAVLAIFVCMPCQYAQAAPSLSISPNGVLGYVANVPVILTLRNPENYQLRSFSFKLNGLEATTPFLQLAVLNSSGSTTTAKLEYLFGPGTYSVAATMGMASPDGNQFVELNTSSQFTVPGDVQDQRKNTILAKIAEFQHQWDNLQFHGWINLGNASTFSDRAFQPAFQVYIDPSYLSDSNAVAAYVEKYVWKYIYTVYDQDLILATEPQNFTVSGSANNSETLWHEMIHAVSHGLQVAGNPSSLASDDHLYIEWAESCIRGFSWLELFEKYAAQNGTASTDAAVQANARQRWKKFVESCNKSTYGSVPTSAQKAEFQRVIGFSADPNAIKQGYLGLGYSPLYFADLSVAISAPASGTQTSENQLAVEASFTNNEPDLTVDRVGLLVNGALQEAPRAGNTFGSTAVLKTGDNTITAVVLTTDGQIFQSSPVVVKSSALNNTYHTRITWDKDGTDVDLHFKWSGGAECYYGNKTPTWVSAETSPRLDVDDRDGFGPENITIGALPGSGTYSLSVHYFSDHGKGATTVYASVYKDGVAVFSDSRTMSNGEDWTLASFSIP